MTYYFHPDAELELNASVDYYQDGLGAEFAYEVQKTILRILQYPTAWQTLDGNIRRCLTNRFPFGNLFSKR